MVQPLRDTDCTVNVLQSMPRYLRDYVPTSPKWILASMRSMRNTSGVVYQIIGEFTLGNERNIHKEDGSHYACQKISFGFLEVPTGTDVSIE